MQDQQIQLLFYSFTRFQTCLKPRWSVQTSPYKCRISRYSCLPTVSHGFRPLWTGHSVSDLFGLPGRTSRYSCFPTVSDSFRPVSDLFELPTNFHINVGAADIAAFLLFQTVSNLFQTSLDCPLLSI